MVEIIIGVIGLLAVLIPFAITIYKKYLSDKAKEQKRLKEEHKKAQDELKKQQDKAKDEGGAHDKQDDIIDNWKRNKPS